MKIIISLILFLYSILVFSQNKPNVIFISIDDLNDYVGCMNGAVKANTPNIDRLAESGTLFANAHCQAPICGPSRASIMTGLYPSTSGNYLQLKDQDIKNSNESTKNSIFMPDYFELFGYKTLGVGKIFHNGDGAESFDEYGGTFGNMYGPRPVERINYTPPMKGTVTDWGAFPNNDDEMPDYNSASWALEKLNEEHDKPFFLAVGFVRPHVPWHVPQKWFDSTPIDSIILPPYLENDMEDVPEIAKRIAEAPMMPTTQDLIKKNEWKKALQGYLACISFVDSQVGRVLNALENSAYANNTLIVLWSDHGYHLGEKNRFAKQALWERNTRTVLIFKLPKGQSNQVCKEAVQLLDIYPTLLELCELPKYKMAEGNSLVPFLTDPTKVSNQPAISFYGVGNMAIRNQRYRLLHYEDGSMEFYDMLTDPNEWVNLADQSIYGREIAKMKKHIPKNWAKLSTYSYYNFNDYFREKSSQNN